MKRFKPLRPSFERGLSLLKTPVAVAALAFAALPSSAAAPLRDLGVAASSAPISAVIWLKGSSDAAFDAAVDALYDRSSPSYHQWMQDGDLAGSAPTAADLAVARASLEQVGLNVDKVFEGGTLVRVSGSVGQLQKAFGTSIHAMQSASGGTLFKAATEPVYKGLHAELIGGISGLAGPGPRPLIVRQLDFATGLAVPGITPPAGTDPLAAFTTDCFGPDLSVTTSGLGGSPGNTGEVTSTFKGPTYLNTTTAIDRLACGYTARQLVQHYGVEEAHALGLKGRGQTIAIVDAYGSPTALADLNAFSLAMGLPVMSDKDFQVAYSDGVPSTTDPEWALETTLDIEWAHAFAPEAKIVLVVTPSNDNAELAYGVVYVADHHLASVVSNSYGTPEVEADASTARMFDHVFKRAAARGVAVNVATGDSGDNGVGTPLGAADVPADSPFATAIGGTSIGVPSDVGPVEAAWGITLAQFGQKLHPFPVPAILGFLQGSGGGESVLLAKPKFQHKLQGKGRQSPDVSALADPQTGAIIVETDPASGVQKWFVAGGTSLATPIFSAIWALADEAAGESLGQAAPIIAALPPFAIRDVLPIKAARHNTSASTRFRLDAPVAFSPARLLGLDQTEPDGFVGTLLLVGKAPYTGWNDIGFGTDSSLMAAPGWDDATGYGVPNGLLFIESAQTFARGR